MNDGPNIASVGALIGEPARASILCALLDGQERTATKLSHIAGVSAPTTSAHLAKLVDGHLLALEKRGRCRYYRLASPEIGRMLETMLAVTDSRPTRFRRANRREDELRHARMCYDHLAGALGVALTDAMLKGGILVLGDEEIELTRRGEQLFTGMGIDIQAARKRRRKFSAYCIDWSEQRPHLSGALGEAFATHCLNKRWLHRKPDTRAVCLTAKGKQALQSLLSVSLDY